MKNSLTPQGNYHKTALRIPRDLAAEIHEAARRNRRTANAEMIARLEANTRPEAAPLDLVAEMRAAADRIESATLPPAHARTPEDRAATQRFTTLNALTSHCGMNLSPSLIERIVDALTAEMQSGPTAWAFSAR